MNRDKNILTELNEVAPLLANISKSMPNALPENYFENFASNSFSFLHELKEEADLIDIEKTSSPYQVTANYFENFPPQLLQKIKAEEVHQIPENYFENLPNILLEKIHNLEVQEELETIAPLLNTIDKTPQYHVPIEYFNKFQITVPKETAKRVPLKTNWFRTAIAACLVGSLGFSVYKIAESPVEIFNVDQALSKADEASMVNYLDNSELVVENPTTTNFTNISDIDKALQDLPAEDLEQHLKENGELAAAQN